MPAQLPIVAAGKVWVFVVCLSMKLNTAGVLGAVAAAVTVAVVAVAAQVPAWTAASSHTAATVGSGARRGSLTWPVLLLGGVPLDPDRALPAVHRPSITVKVSQDLHLAVWCHQT
jgi:hypothetical protein